MVDLLVTLPVAFYILGAGPVPAGHHAFPTMTHWLFTLSPHINPLFLKLLLPGRATNQVVVALVEEGGYRHTGSREETAIYRRKGESAWKLTEIYSRIARKYVFVV